MSLLKRVGVPIVFLLAVEGVIGVAFAQDAWQEADESQLEESTATNREKLNTYFVRVNSFTLSNPSQQFEYVVGESCSILFGCNDKTKSLEVEYDSSTMTTASIGYERLLASGWFSYGVEFYRLSSDFNVSGLPSQKGHLDMKNLLLNSKFYMNPKGVFKPYVGVGAGMSDTTISGSVSGSTLNASVFKYEIGLSYQSDSYIFRAGYVQSNNYVDVDDGTGDTVKDLEFKVDNDLKYSGYFVGVALRI